MEWMKGGFPLLVMGDATIDFKREFEGKIIEVDSIEKMREIVSYYSEIKYLDYPIVIDDISLLNDESVLLKFIEESTLDIILLSHFDRVSNILLSRIRRVVKYYRKEVRSEFLSISKGYSAIKEELDADSHYYDKVRLMSQYSPKMIYLEKTIKKKRNKDKILSFVE